MNPCLREEDKLHKPSTHPRNSHRIPGRKNRKNMGRQLGPRRRGCNSQWNMHHNPPGKLCRFRSRRRGHPHKSRCSNPHYTFRMFHRGRTFRPRTSCHTSHNPPGRTGTFLPIRRFHYRSRTRTDTRNTYRRNMSRPKNNPLHRNNSHPERVLHMRPRNSLTGWG